MCVVEKDTEGKYGYPYIRICYILNSWFGRNSKIRNEAGLYTIQLVEGIRKNSFSFAKIQEQRFLRNIKD